MKIRQALVLGGTSGIGHGIALSLAELGHNVIIAGRSSKRGAEIVSELKSCSSNDSQEHSFHTVDGFNLKSVKELADTVTQNNTKSVDLLVMTQGMATIQGYTPTVDNLDQKLQLHYFSRMYLAKLLAPTISEGGRILSVLSAGVHGKYKGFESDFELKETYSITNAADAAGMYNDVGFEGIAKEYPHLIVCHASPGFVNTRWGTEFPWYLKAMIRPMQKLGRSHTKCGTILANAWLGLPQINTFTGNNYHLMNQDGKPIHKSMKHTKEEGEFIFQKTLSLLPSS